MRITVITPNYNGARFLEETLQSVISQRGPGVELEYIVVDGGSTDGSLAILERYREAIDHLIVEQDSGPANALNKGLRLATGEVVAWLNADDRYYPESLQRVAAVFSGQPHISMCFGRCPIIDPQGVEIRGRITRFKEWFFPLSSRFTYQCINYLSQPALFFRREAIAQVGLLREDMIAAWDYEFILRLWHWGPALQVPGREPLASFRWHPGSISGQHFAVQFREEYEAAVADAGVMSLQALLHFGVRWGIVGIYTGLTRKQGQPVSGRTR